MTPEDRLQPATSAWGAASIWADYAPHSQRITWGTQTAAGHTCFTGLRTRGEALRLAKRWSERFPEHAPYAVTRSPRAGR